MDEELKRYLDGMMQQINDKFDLILDQQTFMRSDMHDMRGHLLYGLHENLTLSQRITKLEESLKRK